MNYYIDFDNTLYETAKLTELMISEIAKTIIKESAKDKKEIIKDVKDNFNSTTGNIFLYAKTMATKYEINPEKAVQQVEKVISKGEKNVFDDARRFLERLKKEGHKIFVLTYIPKTNEEYQMKKILGSGISKYFNGIIISSDYKFNLDLNYENGIFIDDDPRDLKGLYERKPIKVIRMRKSNNKRSRIDMDNPDIEEYESFDDINIPKNNEKEVDRN